MVINHLLTGMILQVPILLPIPLGSEIPKDVGIVREVYLP